MTNDNERDNVKDVVRPDVNDNITKELATMTLTNIKDNGFGNQVSSIDDDGSPKTDKACTGATRGKLVHADGQEPVVAADVAECNVPGASDDAVPPVSTDLDDGTYADEQAWTTTGEYEPVKAYQQEPPRDGAWKLMLNGKLSLQQSSDGTHRAVMSTSTLVKLNVVLDGDLFTIQENERKGVLMDDVTFLAVNDVDRGHEYFRLVAKKKLGLSVALQALGVGDASSE